MAQVIVKKNNKVLNIEGTRLESYLLQGFDQINNDGKVVTKATGGKTVSLAEYNNVLDELEKLKNSLTNTSQEEIENLKKENKSLKSEITKLKKSLDEKKSE